MRARDRKMMFLRASPRGKLPEGILSSPGSRVELRGTSSLSRPEAFCTRPFLAGRWRRTQGVCSTVRMPRRTEWCAVQKIIGASKVIVSWSVRRDV